MGKSQYKKKTQGRRHNPIRVPDAHLGSGKGEGKADPDKEKQMLPILNKLKSPEYADRTWACAAICNLIQNDAATRRLFQSRNVVGELIERLSDSVDEVLVEASGALRNLAIDGGHEMCGEMANKGIMSHLTVLIGKITNTIDSLAVAPKGVKPTDAEFQARKHLLSLAENVISLLWSLAEANPKTLQAVNAVGCEGLLIKVLGGRESFGLDVTLAAAQALYSLTQDNPPFRKAVVSYPNALETIIGVIEEDHTPVESSLAAQTRKGKGKDKQPNGDTADDFPDGRALLRRILVSGVIRNCVLAGSRTDERVNISGLTSGTILPLINGLLDVNLTDVVNKVLQLVQQVPKEVTANLGKNLQTDHRSTAEVSLERIERNLTTVVIASEVLTDICAGLEDEEDVPVNPAEAIAQEEDLDEDEDMDEILADEDLIEQGRDPLSGIEEPAQSPTINPGATLSHLFTTLQLPARLIALSQLTPLSFPPANNQPSPHPPTTSVLSVLHLRALEALNNLLLTAAASLPSGGDSAQICSAVPSQQIWSSMFAIIGAIGSEPDALKMKGQEMRVEVLEMALGCIWGTVKVAPSVLDVQNEQIQTLIDATSVLRSDVAKGRVIEALSALASRPNVSVEQNQVIGTWLIQLLTSSSSPTPEILIAVINAIIDIYADETRAYDQPVFVAGNFLSGLSGTVAKVKGEVKKIDKRKNRQLRTQGEEAYENLVAFIKYRRSLRQ
ncbi:uncharacterized protein I303_103012 [Kwoniella dejecticola CBS 10117]|uniref:SYO1-like TPR repeats domain-containing protein n=1 Tax=Kwoniella dejecticola CBS 10117 TaxID=1296121 RepID=A0A1A6AAC6_9TREE|nr:uncharacterized protein I303_03031 [Kwoniella dejecticola CBS 10117]OBR87009.1 hypothetical protein I303_03031 [Kwoniella dejecticola CBS 10117]